MRIISIFSAEYCNIQLNGHAIHSIYIDIDLLIHICNPISVYCGINEHASTTISQRITSQPSARTMIRD